jgi:cytidine deaminase
MTYDARAAALAASACSVRRRAYAPYSKFLVGAALSSVDGEVFLGCNVENASYGLTICAERAATLAAVSAGRRQFDLLAVATSGGAAPCGACRQFLSEFSPDLPILLVDADQQEIVAQVRLAELLPMQFKLAK